MVVTLTVITSVVDIMSSSADLVPWVEDMVVVASNCNAVTVVASEVVDLLDTIVIQR